MVFAKLTDTAKETGPYRSILTTFAHKSGEAPFLRWRPWRLNLLSVLGLLGLRSLLHDVGVALDEVDGLVDGQILLQVIDVDQLTDLVLFHLVLVCDALDLSRDLFLRSLDVLSGSNSLQSQTGDIEGAYEVKASRPDLDLIFSVTPSRRTPYMNMAKLAGDHVEKVIDHHNTARQQTPPVFDINASIYVFERRFLIENTTGFVWDGKCGMYQMFDTGIIDIDSEHDYLLMEAIAQHLYAHYPEFNAVRENIRG